MLNKARVFSSSHLLQHKRLIHLRQLSNFTEKNVILSFAILVLFKFGYVLECNIKTRDHWFYALDIGS